MYKFGTNLEGVLRIIPERWEDWRGENVELYTDRTLLKKVGVPIIFVQDNISVSTQHVLRGIHGDEKTWKLVSCLYGKVYLVVVDCRRDATSFARWQSFVLSDLNRHQIVIPPGFGNAHLVMSNDALFYYKLSEYYDLASQFTYRWDDPRFNIYWPIQNPILSERDKNATMIK